MAATAAVITTITDPKTETALAAASKLSAELDLKEQAALKMLASVTRALFITPHTNAKVRQDSLTFLISYTTLTYGALQNKYTINVMQWLRELVYDLDPRGHLQFDERDEAYELHRNNTVEQEIIVPIMREIETQCAAGFALIHTQSIMQAASLPAVLINLVRKYCGEDAIVQTGMDLAPHVKDMLDHPPASLTCTFLYNLYRSTQLIPHPIQTVCKFIEDIPSFTRESDMKKLDEELMRKRPGASAVCKLNWEATKVRGDALQQHRIGHSYYNYRWHQQRRHYATTHRVNDKTIFDVYSSNVSPNHTVLSLCQIDPANQTLVPDLEHYLYLAKAAARSDLWIARCDSAPNLTAPTIADHLSSNSTAAPTAITPAFTAASSTSTVSSSAATRLSNS